MSESKTHKLIRYLNDSYATEKGGAIALKDIASRAADPEVKRVADELGGVAENQAERIAARIQELGGSVSGVKAAQNSLLASGNRLSNAFHDIADKQTQDVGKAYGLSAFEESMYTALREYSRAIGDEKTAGLAETLVIEERTARERLLALIPKIAVVPAYQAPEESASNTGQKVAKGAAALTLPALLLGGAALTYWGFSKMRSGSTGGATLSGSETETSSYRYRGGETVESQGRPALPSAMTEGVAVREDVPVGVAGGDSTADITEEIVVTPATPTGTGTTI